MRIAIAITLLFAIVAPQPTLDTELKAIIAASGAEVAVAFKTLDGTSQVLIDADTPFHAASTMKVPVMIELFAQAKAGRLSLDDAVTIRNEFRSIVDGSPYSLSAGDDSDKVVYAELGKTMTLRQLCDAMITVSSNFATNLLIDKLGATNIAATTTKLGADGMHVLRGVEDQKAFDKGLNNSTTARALLVLFERLARRTGRRREGRCGDDRDLEAAGVQRRNPGRSPVRHAGRAQDRQHHTHPSRRGHRLWPAAIRRRPVGARNPG